MLTLLEEIDEDYFLNFTEKSCFESFLIPLSQLYFKPATCH